MKIFVSLLIVTFCVGTSLGQVPSFPAVTALPEQKDLPDPLKMFDGKLVTTKQQWLKQRRPELKALFQHYMYGYLPAAPKIKATVGQSFNDALGGKAAIREVTIDLGKPGAPKINVLLITPNHVKAPAPAILGLNFCGNHTVLNDARVSLNPNWIPTTQYCPGVVNNRATEAARGKGIDREWGLADAIARGYAVVTFYNGDIAPDTPDFTRGVFPHFSAANASKETAWGNIAAWAWGYHRVLDYLVTDKAIDKNRIALFGHSRMGKAALFAAAMDERAALVFPHQAGMGGTAPSRGTVGESVKAINDRFPHWFNDTFPLFNDNPARLPFDQNGLVALMAPRPVMFSCAVEDTWSNPPGQFAVLQAADKVYKFFGVEGMSATTMPKAGNAVNSRLGFFYRPGKHATTNEDWNAFLDFADRHLKGRK
ncbi:MAG TPA: acetylxylan esterase [Blastocatellia bacterium]|nr:acetylxylan esterase [Blastocatellia bacterium]